MPINYSNDRLLDVMNTWRLTNVAAAVILVDEESNDGDASRDRAGRHRLQSALLVRARGFGLFLVQFGQNGAHGHTAAFAGGISADLDAAVPGGTLVYDKGPYESDGFANVQLVQDVQAGNFTHVVIMGQSTNACCAATARGAAALGLNVHTCESVLRGGNVASAAPAYFGVGFAGWPDGTTVYAAL